MAMLYEHNASYASSATLTVADQMENVQVEAALTALIPAALTELEKEQFNGVAITRLAEGLSTVLARYIRWRGWGVEDPESLTSEVLTKVLLRLHLFDAAKGSLFGWACSTAKNAIFDELKEKGAAESSAPTKFDQHRKEFHHIQARPSAAQHAAMLDAILDLSADDQYLLHLLLLEKRSAGEVGQIFVMTEEAVRKRKERLLKQLDAVAS